MPASAVSGSHPLDEYLMMLDECVHTAKGRLEGREPIGTLFCDIENNLCAVDGSLLLR